MQGFGASSFSYPMFGMVARADITRIGATRWNLKYWRGRIPARCTQENNQWTSTFSYRFDHLFRPRMAAQA